MPAVSDTPAPHRPPERISDPRDTATWPPRSRRPPRRSPLSLTRDRNRPRHLHDRQTGSSLLRYTHPPHRRPPGPDLPGPRSTNRDARSPAGPPRSPTSTVRRQPAAATEARNNLANVSSGQPSGYPTSRTTESEHCSTPGNPTGTYSLRSLPREIRKSLFRRHP